LTTTESEHTIPFGLDRNGNLVAIAEAEKGNVYTCPNCGNLLDVRQGPVFDCFAHKKNIPETRECELYSGTWGEERSRQARTPLSEQDASSRKIRLGVRRHPYRPELELIGLLPTVSMDEWLVWRDKPWSISAKGLNSTPTREDFHPSRGRSEFHLDSNVSAHEINVELGPPSLSGHWSSRFESPLPKFLGSINFAEATDSLGRLKSGQYLYVAGDERLALAGGIPVRLSALTLFGFEIDGQVTVKLDEILGNAAIDRRGFEARVILPASEPPLATGSISGPPGSMVLVHVFSSPELIDEPAIEIIELPSTSGRTTVLPSGKRGIPRQFTFEIRPDEARRFVLYWSGRQVYVQASPVPDQNVGRAEPHFPALSLTYKGKRIVHIVASFDRGIITSLPEDTHLRGDASRWEVGAPPGLELALEYTRTSGDVGMERVRREGIVVERIPAAIESSLPESVGPMFVDGGLLGLVGFSIDRFSQSWMDTFDFEANIRRVGFCRGHVTWGYIRAVTELPVGVSHHSLPGGLKKRIRQVNRTVMENRGESKEWIGKA
jgi:hypothetical protein